jgi:hypothetical protein
MSDRIEQLIDVIREVRDNYKAASLDAVSTLRTDAVRKIAIRRNILESTVSDKYRRQLNPPISNTKDFDRLLAAWLQTGSSELQNALYTHSEDSADQRLIKNFFQADLVKPKTPVKVSIKLSPRLQKARK